MHAGRDIKLLERTRQEHGGACTTQIAEGQKTVEQPHRQSETARWQNKAAFEDDAKLNHGARHAGTPPPAGMGDREARGAAVAFFQRSRDLETDGGNARRSGQRIPGQTPAFRNGSQGARRAGSKNVSGQGGRDRAASSDASG